MTTDFYVVRHHGAWRIRVNGKHSGEYNSRVSAIDAAVKEAQEAEPGARVFSTGIVHRFAADQDRTGRTVIWTSTEFPHEAPARKHVADPVRQRSIPDQGWGAFLVCRARQWPQR
jgi:hypothetical protein